MKDYKGKTSTSDGVFADNAVISTINGNNTIDVWAKASKGKDNGEIKFVVAIDLGGVFLSSSNNGDKFKEAKKMVHEFAMKTTKEAIAGNRKAAQKVLDGLEDDKQDLEKKQEKLNSNIEDYKGKIEDYNKKIKEAQDDLGTNKTDQDKKKGEVDAQKKVVEAVTAKENSVD
jgi:peptidoglycan hydrolase CwlO-like protein